VLVDFMIGKLQLFETLILLWLMSNFVRLQNVDLKKPI
jgi:hypothetical protein